MTHSDRWRIVGAIAYVAGLGGGALSSECDGTSADLLVLGGLVSAAIGLPLLAAKRADTPLRR